MVHRYRARAAGGSGGGTQKRKTFEVSREELLLLRPVVLTPRRHQRRRGTIADVKDLQAAYARDKLKLKASIAHAELRLGTVHETLDAIGNASPPTAEDSRGER